MKRMIGVAITLAALMATLSGCMTTPDAEETAAAAPEVSPDAIPVENAFYYTHVDGHKKETEMVAFVLFEYEQLKTVKYQVSYIACTCRAPQVNYYSVAYVELSKEDGSISFLSYELDSEEHYIAGLYGDSAESWDGTPVREIFDRFLDDTLRGATQDEINAIEPMHGTVDGFTGATVTPNNAVRMLQGLFRYHNKKYM